VERVIRGVKFVDGVNRPGFSGASVI
jgi:hypothetical protein